MDWKIFLTDFAAVFIAELGDKTQLATMLFAADKEVSKYTVFLAAVFYFCWLVTTLQGLDFSSDYWSAPPCFWYCSTWVQGYLPWWQCARRNVPKCQPYTPLIGMCPVLLRLVQPACCLYLLRYNWCSGSWQLACLAARIWQPNYIHDWAINDWCQSQPVDWLKKLSLMAH